MIKDIYKVIYSDNYDSYLALKFREVRKDNNNFDHLVIEVCDRELFADYIINYNLYFDIEIIFEQKEEFSIVINSIPFWFSFEDLERHKKYELMM